MKALCPSMALVILLFTCSCSPGVDTTSTATLYAVSSRRGLIKHYGQIELSIASSYLNYVTSRLLSTSNKPPNTPLPRFTILKTDQTLALSPGPNFIFLSLGLIRLIENESQLAFVLAHEIAHQDLEQGRAELSQSIQEMNFAKLHDCELAADTNALKSVILAGYNPYTAITVLNNAFSASEQTASSTHPQVEQRLRHLHKMLLNSGWRGPGTTNRREFNKFKHSIPEY